MSIEQTILKNLVVNDGFSRKVLPFLKEEYFMENMEKTCFKIIRDYILKYNNPPTVEALGVILDATIQGLTDSEAEQARANFATYVKDDKPPDLQWLQDQTEAFCQDKAIYNAMSAALQIMENKSKKLDKGSIPKLLSDALAVSFDPNVGHDYLEQTDERFESYHKVHKKIPFDLEFFNLVTNNGVNTKSLNIILAGTGVGKSLMMCHFAAAALNIGKNVLYITLELSEEKVAERIDANLMNINLDEIEKLPKDVYLRRMAAVKSKTNGKLIIKEYPTSGANSLHFKALLNELHLKKKFKPDMIMVDYLNICSSSRYKPGQASMYEYIKGIAEELRGMAVECGIPIWSATQTNRAGFVSSDPGLEHTSESFGLPATCDFMISVVSTDELEKLGQYMITQLKNRYGNPTMNKRFVIGVDKAKMKLYDIENSAQDDIANSKQESKMKPTGSSFGKPTVSASMKEKFKKLKV